MAYAEKYIYIDIFRGVITLRTTEDVYKKNFNLPNRTRRIYYDTMCNSYFYKYWCDKKLYNFAL
jgi:hypothetical protein